MKRISILVKPTDACNMRCKYCFHEKSGYNQGLMSSEIFDKMLFLLEKEYDSVNIVWHGGEPLLAPLHFYEYAYKKCEQSGLKMHFSLQTNATLLDDSTLDFFRKKQTNIGISFDGTVNEQQRGKTNIVLQNIKKLKAKGFDPGAIMVVTQNNVNRLNEEYDFFKNIGISVKFNPMFPDGEGEHHPELDITVEQYIKSFTEFFLHWLNDKDCNINMITCQEYVKLILYHEAGVCTYNSCLGNWLCIDSVGNIYPCDRLCISKYRLGNIQNLKTFTDVFQNESFYNLLSCAVKRREVCKEKCNYYNMCYGGCNANAELYGNLSSSENNLCLIHKGILANISQVVLESASDDFNGFNPKFRIIAERYNKLKCNL